MEIVGIASVAAITVIAYLIGEVVKATGLDNKWIPVICGVCGGALGVVGMMIMPGVPGDGLHNRRRRRHRVRPRSYRRQSDR